MEDWSYYSTGGLGFTFEIGPDHFHPPFADMVAEYTGATAAADGHGGNRAAYLLALRSTTNKERHSIIRGAAPRGSLLTLSKRFRTPTSPVIDGATGEEGDVIFFKDRLRYQLPVRRSGRFAWHVNPSTRPLVDPRTTEASKPTPGQPSEPVAFNGDATTTVPCADAETEDPSCWNDHPFRVPGGDGIDNGRATVKITWPTPASDWDMKVFRDSDRDGSSAGEGTPLGSSASGPTTSEETTIAAPGLRRGKYVVRVINFAGAEPYQGTVTFRKTQPPLLSARRERWTLKCQAQKNSPVLSRQKVYVKRGRVATVDLTRSCR